MKLICGTVEPQDRDDLQGAWLSKNSRKRKKNDRPVYTHPPALERSKE